MLEPYYAGALNSRCMTRAKAGAFDGALADCNEALRKRPDNLNIRDSRAFAYPKKRSLDEALAD
jgi:Flp pilus assembly protein TadD